ncbi:MAG: NHL repeat-containing protein [Candidatus Cohnella colombiensis]|uniref:NHL repeat-containing protein n=1 Tax=Candidatus Cohnella colombiensis TaxID=3121368 RepID=A0AA95EXJ4_9BACL|nr:MAG: NHL repeat-containing protein [Cohnella sp.]
MRISKWFRTLALSSALCVGGLMLVSSAQAAVPYVGYTYDGWNDRVWAPVAYAPAGVIAGETLGIGVFSNPDDLFVTDDKRVLIVDTGNSRIVVLDEQYRLLQVIDSFTYEGKEDKFNKPTGVFVTPDNEIYVADTDNHRVVRMSFEGQSDHIIVAPSSEFFATGFVFEPKKIVVDSAERVYVIANRVFDGIMQFDSKGNFENYFAANRVKYSVGDYVWKKYLSTKEQQSRTVQFIPTEYLSMDIDKTGFVYTTSVDDTSAGPKPIQRHNPTGTDVLIRQGFANPFGDLRYGPAGPSRLIDINVGPDGTYSTVDYKRGRVFTYDSEGKLLYIFGGIDDRVGTFREPSAVERIGDSYLVLDKNLQRMTIFNVTHFGQLMNDAVHYHYIGDEEKAAELWREILSLDANLDIAYSGVSKSMVREGDNENAADYAKYGMDRKSYSKAYKGLRKEVLKENFNAILTTILVLAIATFVLVQIRKYRRRKGGATHVESAD